MTLRFQPSPKVMTALIMSSQTFQDPLWNKPHRFKTTRSELLARPFLFTSPRPIRQMVNKRADDITEAIASRCGPSRLVTLPTEILLQILGCVGDSYQVWKARAVCRLFRSLCVHHPTAHRLVEISSIIKGQLLLPSQQFSILERWTIAFRGVLSQTQAIDLTGLTVDPLHLSGLFKSTSWNKLSRIDAAFCSSLRLSHLESLYDNGIRLTHLHIRACVDFLDGHVLARCTPALEDLDLSFTRLRCLPEIAVPLVVDEDDFEATLVDDQIEVDRIRPWPKLKRLNLSGCNMLKTDSLRLFLTTHALFPPLLEHLNLSHLSPFHLELWVLGDLCVTQTADKGAPPNALQTVDLKGVDHVTRQDVDFLESHWADGRGGDKSLVIQPSAILLDAHNEAAYRRFIAMMSLGSQDHNP